MLFVGEEIKLLASVVTERNQEGIGEELNGLCDRIQEYLQIDKEELHRI